MAIDDGRVSHVRVYPNFDKNELRITVTEQEGYGETHTFTITLNHSMNIPTQVELFMMDFNCVPTWYWHESIYVWDCEFAHYKNHKAVKSNADQWDTMKEQHD